MNKKLWYNMVKQMRVKEEKEMGPGISPKFFKCVAAVLVVVLVGLAIALLTQK